MLLFNLPSTCRDDRLLGNDCTYSLLLTICSDYYRGCIDVKSLKGFSSGKCTSLEESAKHFN